MDPVIHMQKTALNSRHRQLGAKMTDFHGWEMPLYYTSILDEHRAVREAAGLFDVSHMGQVLVTGPDAEATLNRIVVSDVSQVGEGRACYTLILNEQGGILDDIIVFRTGSEHFLVIINCGGREADVAWLKAHARGRTMITDISEGRAILAVQGPGAARLLERSLDARVMSLGRFGIAPIRTMGPDACLARTGYTGGDGFELFVPDAHAVRVWDLLLGAAGASSGIKPVGLGARDTLRVEAGLRLYGTDMDTTTTPWEAGLGWTVAMRKPVEFIGQAALARQQQAGVPRVFVGFELAQGPVPRAGCELFAADGTPIGAVKSGTFSPMLNRPLGMGYVLPAHAAPGTAVSVTVRSQRYTGTIVKLPFWKPPVAPLSVAAARAATLEKLP